MVYDKGLAQRVREHLEEIPGFDEKSMFGGICFLIHGNMAGGVVNDDLIVRVGVDAYPALLKKPHARPFDLTGKSMKGWLTVSSEGLEAEEDMAGWLEKSVRFAQALPPKQAGSKIRSGKKPRA